MKIINHFALLLLFGCAVSCTQPENSISNESIGIIPLPSTYELKPGTFYITGQSSIGIDKSDPEMTALANYFNEEISDATGFSLPVNNSGTIIFQLGEHKELGEEGYQLSISSDQLILSAYKHHGIFNGIQSVLQLLPPEIKSKTVQADATWSINCIEVTDKPQFAWRGLMLDVSRHFFTKQEVKKFIDQMAEYKYNVFHWHLTDDQGWRLEVKSLPGLTAIGAWRAPRVGNWWEREPQLPELRRILHNRRYPGNCRICTTALCNHRARNRYSRTQHGSPVGLSGNILYGRTVPRQCRQHFLYQNRKLPVCRQ
jgi:hexosaminidase